MIGSQENRTLCAALTLSPPAEFYFQMCCSDWKRSTEMKVQFGAMKGDGLVRISSVCAEHCPKLWKHALFLLTRLITIIFIAQKKEVYFPTTVQKCIVTCEVLA